MIQLIRISGRGIFVAFAIGLAIALSYFLGHSVLDGQLAGSDSPLHINYSLWLSEQFPTIPHWYPDHGAGVSLVHGYPILPHLLVVVLHKITDFSILQVFRILSFVTFPLAAIGIWIFCWSELKSKTAGVISIVIFLIAPVTWTWMFNWGFFAQQTALWLLPIGLLCFNRAFNAELARKPNGERRLWLAAFATLMVGAVLSHMMVASAIALGSLSIGIFRLILSPRANRRLTVSRGLKPLILAFVLVSLVLAGYLVPFVLYGREANPNGLSTPAAEEMHELPILEFFGLKSSNRREVLSRMQFPLVGTVLAGVGIIPIAILRRRGSREAELGLALWFASVASVVFVLSPSLSRIVLGISKTLWYFVNFRSVLLVTTFLIPILAGYGTHSAFRLLVGAKNELSGSEREVSTRNYASRLIRNSMGALLALVAITASIIPLGSVASSEEADYPFGPSGLKANDLWQLGGVDRPDDPLGQLGIESWPPIAISDTDRSIELSKGLSQDLPDDRHIRVDVSPYLGERAKDLVAYSNTSQINTYTFQLNLMKSMWSFEQGILFTNSTEVDEFGTATTLKEAADWFGIEYSILNQEHDPIDHYIEAGWDLLLDEDIVQIWANPEPTSLVTATSRPTILVVGTPESDAYMTIFRLSNQGMISFSDAILVEGRPRIDDYELRDLELFDALILYGYDYKSSVDAWALLDSYVANGGSLFIDTGWEFWIPEWEFEKAPSVLPVENLKWTNYGTSGTYELGMPEITGAIDASKFKPLEWEGMPWTLSGAAQSDIREWGMPVLSNSGAPLIIAGHYGEGKVVWSGMNLLAHARYLGRNEQEIGLAHNVFSWLIDGEEHRDLEIELIQRDNPDQVEFRIPNPISDDFWIYWREAYYPNWQASITDSQGERVTKIFRAGPGLMLVNIDSASGDTHVTLTWSVPVIEKAALGISVIGLLLLAAFYVDGLLLNGEGFSWLKIALLVRTPRPFLGDGDNTDWAERKRQELLTRGDLSIPRNIDPSEAISWHPSNVGDPSADDGDLESQLNPNVSTNSLPEDDQINATEVHEADPDEAWAEKILKSR